ncbi:MAG: iron-containing alcohol dehydrogenase [Firmicutes bacterium]|jgi:alcohol dehydrogenase class IV|nr:iron-containing alcohol dehydrogenase [Bacillota bacterium]HQD39042.1 iron-containing alcohol dehydrogenase [Bacillota bacterium]
MEFALKTRVVVGAGEHEKLGTYLSWRSALIVAGRNVQATGAVEAVEASLKKAGITPVSFCEAAPDPSLDLVEKGTAFLKENAPDADGIVAIGGGSAIDLGKAIAVMAANPGPLAEYEGPERFPNQPLPVAALPTTAGTGSEVTPSSVLTDTERQYKFLLWSKRIVPELAVLDPTLAMTAPRKVRLAAGLDALTHAVESVLSRASTVYTEPLALKAIEIIGRKLPQVVLGQDDPGAMEEVLVAANLAGLAFSQTRLGVVHALALPLSARFGIPHGLAVAVLLPQGLKFNLSVAQERYQKILASFGRQGDLAEVIRDFSAELGGPTKMRQLGVTAEEIPAMAKDASGSGHLAVNPRFCSLEDLEAIYQAAL